MTHLYRLGAHPAAVGESVVVIFGMSTDPSLVLAVYDILHGGGGVREVEQHLEAVEDCVIAPRGGDPLVRGRFCAQSVDGAVTLTWPGAPTWSPAVQLPVRCGVVLVSEMVVAWTESTPDPLPELVPETEAEHPAASAVGTSVTEEWRGEVGSVDVSADLVGIYHDMFETPSVPAMPPPPPPPSSTPAEIAVGDHDGLTSMWSQMLTPPLSPVAMSPIPVTPVIEGPTVLARVCPLGHPNPPHRGGCRVCGAPLEGESRTVPRPVLGSIRMSTGVVHQIERPASIGRQPAAVRASGYDVPQLITVPNPSGDISRSHLELKVDGWHVLAVDLGSTNGSFLRRGGHSPQRLLPHDPVLLVDHDIVVLGDEITLTFEGLS